MYNWYIAVPEAVYITMIGIRFLGPLGLLAWPAYSISLSCYPVPTMIAVGVVAAAQAAVVLFKNIAGDRIAKDKEAEYDNGSNGIPRLSGDDKKVQDALDKMHEDRQAGPDEPHE